MRRLDAAAGHLEVLTGGARDRAPAAPDLSASRHGLGRELFGVFRGTAGPAATGASAAI